MKALKIAMILAAAILVNCGGKGAKNNVSGVSDNDTSFTDKRDGQVYKTVKIGDQVWMAQNLNYPLIGSKCFADENKYTQQYYEDYPEEETLTDEEVREKCEKYGRLYDWYMAKDAVPAGWHLPSVEEWKTLADFVGKEFKLLEENNFSTFGWGTADGNFWVASTERDEWWSATEYEYWDEDAGQYNATNAYGLYIGYEFDDEGIIGDKVAKAGSIESKNDFYYVRCIKDAPQEKAKKEEKPKKEKQSKKKKEYGVFFNYTNRDELNEYKSYDSLIDNPRHPKIIFYSDVPVKDFSYIDLDIVFNEDNQLQYYPSKALFSTKELRPEKPFVASWIEVGIMSAFGYSYRDENGKKIYFVGKATNYGGDPEDYDGPALVSSQIFPEKYVTGRYQYFDDENTLTLDLTDTSYTLKLNDYVRKGKAEIEFSEKMWCVTLEGIKWDRYDKKIFSDDEANKLDLCLRTEEDYGLMFQNSGSGDAYYSIFDGIGEKFVYFLSGERLEIALADQDEEVKIQNAKSSLSTFTDSRDKKIYKTVTIGAQTWMAQNLNFATEGSRCFDDEDGNCEKYGRLYTWDAAQKAVPAGWHLPTDDEWITLTNHIGGAETGGKYLKSASGWNDNGNGSDDYGFSALPAGNGFYLTGGDFGGFGKNGEMASFWSATEAEKGGHWYRTMRGENEKITKYYADKNLFSVRCVKD